MKELNYKSIFLNDSEKFVCALGNNYIQNFLSGEGLQKGFAVLSDKRVYFKGSCFVRNGKRFSKSTEERVVDVKDVTGSGFISKNPIWAIIISIIFLVRTVFSFISLLFFNFYIDSNELVPMFAGALLDICIIGVFYYIYKSKKHNFFQIQYAGGVIAFDTKWYGIDEAQKFQKALRLTKDAYEQRKELSSIKPDSVDDSADKLKKYSELLNSGSITKDEFNKIKEKLLNDI